MSLRNSGGRMAKPTPVAFLRTFTRTGEGNMGAELAFKSGVIGLGILSSVMLSIVVFSF